MLEAPVIERTLDKLEAVHSELVAGELDDALVDEAGYAAVHVARHATEEAYQQLHRRADFALRLKDRKIYGVTFDQAQKYLKDGLAIEPQKDSPQERVMLAVANLMGAIRRDTNSFVLALQAKEAAILLLGPNRLGGVYAEWQASTLAVGIFTWSELQRFNQRILGLVRGLDPQRARQDAERFELPLASFIEVGCHKNIAVACFRAAADEQDLEGISAEQVLAIGSEALLKLDHDVAIDPQQFEEYQVATVYARERALLDKMGKRDRKSFWERLARERAAKIVKDVQKREISASLRELVVESARNAGIEI
ncbi:MAG: hypothetical protein GY719_25420 [bacterium]|nr:hypothetical protein [bacterium]